MSAARVVFWVSFGAIVTVLVLERLLRLGSPLSGRFLERLQDLARKAAAGEPLTAPERRAWHLRWMLAPVVVAQPFLPDRWAFVASLAGLAILGAYVVTVARLPAPSPPASPASS